MTYNILLGGRRGAPLHELVRTVAPDVLLVNEAPKSPLLSARDCRRLARLWGMRYVAGGRSAGSNMLLVRGPVEVRRARTVRLKQPLFQPRRGLVVAQLRVHGRLVGVVSCHLSLDAVRRRREVAEVMAQAATLRGPVIVAGDLNETPHGPVWQDLVAHGFADHGGRPGARSRPTLPGPGSTPCSCGVVRRCLRTGTRESRSRCRRQRATTGVSSRRSRSEGRSGSVASRIRWDRAVGSLPAVAWVAVSATAFAGVTRFGAATPPFTLPAGSAPPAPDRPHRLSLLAGWGVCDWRM